MEEHTFHDKPNLNFNYSNTSNLNSLLVNYKIQFKDSFNNKANEFKNTNMTTYTQSNPYQEQQKKKIDEYEGLLHRITQLERENKELQMVLKSTSMNINNKEMNEISRLSDYNTNNKKIQSDKEEKIRYSNRYLEEDNIRHSSKNKLITSTSSQYKGI
jgi:predicted transcriptional regulator